MQPPLALASPLHSGHSRMQPTVLGPATRVRGVSRLHGKHPGKGSGCLFFSLSTVKCAVEVSAPARQGSVKSMK